MQRCDQCKMGKMGDITENMYVVGNSAVHRYTISIAVSCVQFSTVKMK